jgi:hypothetical protein
MPEFLVPPAIDPFATHPRAKDDQKNRFSSINNTKSTSQIKNRQKKQKKNHNFLQSPSNKIPIFLDQQTSHIPNRKQIKPQFS